MPDLPHHKAHAHPYQRSSELHRGNGTRISFGRRTYDCRYAELAVTSNFTFLTGASHADELVRRAGQLGYDAVAITDRNSLAGIVRAHVAAKEAGIRLIVGCQLVFAEPQGLTLLVYPTDRQAYGRLCRLLTLGKRRAAKGECRLTLADFLEHQEGLLGVMVLEDSVPIEKFGDDLHHLRDALEDDRLSLAVTRLFGPDDREHLRRRAALADRLRVPLVAVNDVRYHVPERRVLQDVLTCIRHGCTLSEAGLRLFPNSERHLKPPEEIARLFADLPMAITRTREIAERTKGFSLDQLRYEYPDETCPPGISPMDHLRNLTWQGASDRYPEGVPGKVRGQIEHEFALIDELRYAPYFLTVRDLVTFARSRGIPCQGRGAAANSAVCYCLGVTSVDPDRIDVLFERFVSRERDEPPDIDIDFEHERREEVIRYIYGKYGRERAGLTAEVITYRRRSAIRDVGKALGFSLDAVDRIAKRVDTWERNPFADSESGDVPAQLTALGFDAADATVQRFVHLVREILGFPRHLSQHVGGFVMTRGPLCELVPIENAAMPERTVIEWDKDDIEAMGMLKVDVLGLGMLTCIGKALEMIHRHEGTEARRHRGTEGNEHEEMSVTSGDQDVSWGATKLQRCEKEWHKRCITKESQEYEGGLPFPPCLRASVPSCLAEIPPEDPAVYDMICKADTLGVFQIESRAQMTMLPRLRPRCFYDLVIEVAIVRPGPIVGEMVHPYLRRRNGEEPVVYPDAVIERVLGKTLGVPLFQEQVMALAIQAAGFTPGEAEKLRRAITAWTAKEDIAKFPGRFVEGMVRNGYSREFAEWCFQRFKGFSQYGFPESHAASFALLVYASAWLKCYYPAAFAAALLNSQPMGFYAPAQIVHDARDHGVEVRGLDVNHSEWDCTLEGRHGEKDEGILDASRKGLAPGRRGSGHALRLGMRMVKGLREDEARAIVAAVGRCGPFASPLELWRESGASAASLQALARADAFGSMNLDRRRALWEVQPLSGRALPLLDGLSSPRSTAVLPQAPPMLDVGLDYAAVGLSLKAHPVSFLRQQLSMKGVSTAAEIKDPQRTPTGRTVAVAGIVLFRQRPGTAKGVMFMTLEDETGRVDLIVRPKIYERYRSALVYGTLLLVRGKVERKGQVVHVLARRAEDIQSMTVPLPRLSRDFR